MKVIFMGTPEFAADILRAVHDCPVELTAVFTQPDRPVGRRQVLTPPAVKVLAQEYGLPVFQPERIKRPRWTELLRSMEPDLVIVAAYGQILSQEILDIPRLGCINVHASLLPRYRGAAPIQRCIADGETVTGVTAMQMDAGMDTGDILLKREVPIRTEDTALTLSRTLANEGALLIREVIRRLLQGKTLPREKQNEAEATYAPMLKKEEGLMDWTQSAKQLDGRIRGFDPWPGAYTFWGERKLLIEKALPLEEKGEGVPGAVQPYEAQAKHKTLRIQTGSGLLEIQRLQLQGKKSMTAEDFLRGNSLQGVVLGGPQA